MPDQNLTPADEAILQRIAATFGRYRDFSYEDVAIISSPEKDSAPSEFLQRLQDSGHIERGFFPYGRNWHTLSDKTLETYPDFFRNGPLGGREDSISEKRLMESATLIPIVRPGWDGSTIQEPGAGVYFKPTARESARVAYGDLKFIESLWNKWNEEAFRMIRSSPEKGVEDSFMRGEEGRLKGLEYQEVAKKSVSLVPLPPELQGVVEGHLEIKDLPLTLQILQRGAAHLQLGLERYGSLKSYGAFAKNAHSINWSESDGEAPRRELGDLGRDVQYSKLAALYYLAAGEPRNTPANAVAWEYLRFSFAGRKPLEKWLPPTAERIMQRALVASKSNSSYGTRYPEPFDLPLEEREVSALMDELTEATRFLGSHQFDVFAEWHKNNVEMGNWGGPEWDPRAAIRSSAANLQLGERLGGGEQYRQEFDSDSTTYARTDTAAVVPIMRLR